MWEILQKVTKGEDIYIGKDVTEGFNELAEMTTKGTSTKKPRMHHPKLVLELISDLLHISNLTTTQALLEGVQTY